MFVRLFSYRVVVLVLSVFATACGGQERVEPPTDDRLVVEIRVDASGYHPAEASAPPGQPLRLVFTRTTDEGCGQQLVFPDLDIRRDLPLNEQVAVDLTMPTTGAVHFTCGMAMYEGSIVVR